MAGDPGDIVHLVVSQAVHPPQRSCSPDSPSSSTHWMHGSARRSAIALAFDTLTVSWEPIFFTSTSSSVQRSSVLRATRPSREVRP